MNYRRDNESKKRRIGIFLLIVVIALFFLYQGKILPAVFDKTQNLAASVFGAGTVAEESVKKGALAAFSFKKSLVSENEILKAKINEYEAKILERDALSAENSELKALLGRGDKEKIILANILAKPNQSPYDTLVLDIGSDNGISAGNLVLAYGSVVIGEIRETTANVSKAVLFSSYGEEHRGILSGKNIPVKLLGRGGGNFMAEFPRGVLIEKEDIVISLGISPHVFGSVESVFSDPRDPYQSVLVRSPVNIYELRFVGILIP
ncbi:MAG: rod shape-determining protein MreC [Patescibacteria group bacterium]